MKTNSAKQKTESPLRLLPSVDALINTVVAKSISAQIGANKLTELARLSVEELRAELREAVNGNYSKENLLEKAETILRRNFETADRQKFQRVINATGVIVHTNLGRAPLAEAAKQAIIESAGYCTLEYDLETGKRGRRGRQVEELIGELTGAESAVVVNNCAAATFLVLSALGAGGEAIVSRGELVEIGGDFRVPDVMAQSGVRLVEVGTTNRTKLKDFADAVTENTKLFVRVHPSNFRIVGFTAMPSLQELAELAREKNVVLFEDAGSGALTDLSKHGLNDEPLIPQSIAAGADVVTFSGDKLLGGVQAGFIIGKSEIIEKIRKNPLYRALRVDKIAYAALAATLEIYQKEQHFSEIPVLRMLAQTKEEIRQRAEKFIEEFKVQSSKFKVQTKNSKPETLNFGLVEGVSAVGGGSAPLAELPTTLISIKHLTLKTAELERRLRIAPVPIAARIADGNILLDLRTVSSSEVNEILSVLLTLSSEG
jgi:L-seryl-tRNA(Ser) seleniumtransferase